MDQAVESVTITANLDIDLSYLYEQLFKVFGLFLNLEQAAESVTITENLNTYMSFIYQQLFKVYGLLLDLDQAVENAIITEISDSDISILHEELFKAYEVLLNVEIEVITITENLNAASGSLTEENAITPVTKESNGGHSDKGKQNLKEKTGNEKSTITNVDAKKVKVVPAPEKKTLKRKAEHPPTSEMVMDSIKALRKSTGATLEDIGKYMEEKYPVKTKTLKSHINNFLKKSVVDGVLEKIGGAGDQERFKIKKLENTKQSSKNVLGKDGKGKPMKKMIATKRKVKK